MISTYLVINYRLIQQCLRHNSENGFTLFELIVTISIIAIVAALAMPSFVSMLKRQESYQTRYHINNAIYLARAESLIKHQDIIFCAADSNLLCNKDDGAFLLVFTDTDGNRQYDANSNRLLLAQPLNLSHGKIYLRASNRHYVKFFADTGLPRGHFGHIKYCPTLKESAMMYQVSWNAQGIVRFKPDSFKPTGCP